MPRHSVYRPRGGVDPVGNDWSPSTGQLGIGIAVTVVFGLVCFILGYIVANVDRPLQPGETMAAVSANPADADEPGSAGDETDSSGSGGSEDDSGGASRDSREAEGEETDTPASPSRAPGRIPRTGLSKAEIEPLPAPGKPTTLVKTPVNLNRNPADETAETPLEVDDPPPITPPEDATPERTEPASREADTDGGADSAPQPPPVLEEPEEPAAPAETEPAPEPAEPAAPTVTRGSFGVQVAAFNGPRRADQAQEARRRLLEATGLDADIVQSADGEYDKVVLTGYSSRDAARAQCEKLKQKSDYAGAWVVRLP